MRAKIFVNYQRTHFRKARVPYSCHSDQLTACSLKPSEKVKFLRPLQTAKLGSSTCAILILQSSGLRDSISFSTLALKPFIWLFPPLITMFYRRCSEKASGHFCTVQRILSASPAQFIPMSLGEKIISGIVNLSFFIFTTYKLSVF